MAKYKAKDTYKTAENTYFNIGTVEPASPSIQNTINSSVPLGPKS